MRSEKTFCSIGITLAVALLFIALLDNPADWLDLDSEYFTVLRFSITVISGLLALHLHKRQEQLWRNAFAVIALLYNPFLPVEFGSRDIWAFVNGAVLIVFILAAKTTCRYNPFKAASRVLGVIHKKIVCLISKTVDAISSGLKDDPGSTLCLLFVVSFFVLAGLFLGGAEIYKLTGPGQKWHASRVESSFLRQLKRLEWTHYEIRMRAWDSGDYSSKISKARLSDELISYAAEYFTTDEQEKHTFEIIELYKNSSYDSEAISEYASGLVDKAESRGFKGEAITITETAY